VPTSIHICYSHKDPSNEKLLFQVPDRSVPSRSAASIAASAADFEHARALGRSVAFQTRLEQKRGVKVTPCSFLPDQKRAPPISTYSTLGK